MKPPPSNSISSLVPHVSVALPEASATTGRSCRQRGAALRSHDLELLPAPRPSPLSFYIYIRSAIAIANLLFFSFLRLSSSSSSSPEPQRPTTDAQLLIAAAPCKSLSLSPPLLFSALFSALFFAPHTSHVAPPSAHQPHHDVFQQLQNRQSIRYAIGHRMTETSWEKEE